MKIKNIITFLAALGVLVLLPLLLSNSRPIEVHVPQVSQEDIKVQEEKKQHKAQVAAVQNKTRKIYACEADEDCIIVDNNPCGCVIGPSGRTAINAAQIQEFEKMNFKEITSSCPDTPPSTENECSNSAQAVCQAGACKISY